MKITERQERIASRVIIVACAVAVIAISLFPPWTYTHPRSSLGGFDGFASAPRTETITRFAFSDHYGRISLSGWLVRVCPVVVVGLASRYVLRSMR